MNVDPGLVNKVLTAIPYPVGKDNLIQQARQHGANDQILGMLQRLPDKTFNSPQDIQSSLGGFGMPGMGGGPKH